jgi:hypothetical protein
MTCTAYIRDEKSWSSKVPYSMYMACGAYLRVEIVGPETSPRPCT